MDKNVIGKNYSKLIKECAKNLRRVNNIETIHSIISLMALPDWCRCFVSDKKDKHKNIRHLFITMIGVIDYQLMNETLSEAKEEILVNQRRKNINDCDCLYSNYLSSHLFELFHDILSPKKYDEIKPILSEIKLLESHQLGYRYSKYVEIEEIIKVYNEIYNVLYKKIQSNKERKINIEIKQKIKQIKN